MLEQTTRNKATASNKDVVCVRCGARFSCNPGPDCWCAKEPLRPMPKDATGCLCPSCFARGDRAG